jgi:hypothetical protein
MAPVFEVRPFASAETPSQRFCLSLRKQNFQNEPESISRFAFRSKRFEQLDRLPGVRLNGSAEASTVPTSAECIRIPANSPF